MSATFLGISSLLVNETIYEEDNSGIATFTRMTSVNPSTSVTPSLSQTIQISGVALRMVSVNTTSSSDFKRFTEIYQGRVTEDAITQRNATNATSEEPIETHPQFNTTSASIVNLSGGALTEGDAVNSTTGGAVFDQDGRFLYFNRGAKAALFGVSSYLSPSLVYRRAYSTSTTPSLTKVGRIVTPAGDFPSVTSGVTWLCTGIQYTQKGKSFDVSEDFRASDTKGWNEYIYGNSVTA